MTAILLYGWSKTRSRRPLHVPLSIRFCRLEGGCLAFPDAFNTDAAGFVASEIARADKTVSGYANVFRTIPIIIIVCAGLFLILKAPLWQSSMLAAIAMLMVIMLVDTNASARMQTYKQQMMMAEKQQYG